MVVGEIGCGMRKFLGFLGLVVLGGVVVGCESSGPTTRPMSISERQDKALADPMGYKPDFSRDHVTSGGIGDLDKDGLQRDLKSVFNP